MAVDDQLIDVRTDRLKGFLPKEIAALVDSKSGAGVRLLLA
jgi:hypothetical protein